MAKISGITIAINADTSGVTSSLKELTGESVTLTKQLKAVENSLKLDPQNTELLTLKQELLAKSVEASAKKLEALKAAQEDVKKAAESGSIGTDEYIAFQREIAYTENRLRTLKSAEEEAGTETDNLGKKTDEAAKDISTANEDSKKFSDTLKNAVVTGAAAAADALVSLTKQAIEFAKSAVSVGMDFDAAISQIGATLGYTVDDLSDKTSESAQNLQMLRDKAQQMGAETSFSATEAAEGLNILAMSGYSAEEACSMLDDVLNLAASGSLTLAESAKFTSGAIKGFADDTKDAQYYADIMAKGATLANTNVRDLGEALSGGAATAASYGQSAESLTVSLLRMAEQGVTGTTATTSLNRAMADLYTATDVAKAELDKLGVSAYDVATGSAREFNDVVDDLNAALAGMSDEEANAIKNTIFTTNGLSAFNKMTVTSTEKVDEWSAALADATGSAEEQSKTMLDNLKGDIKIFGSAVEGAQIALSDALSPALREFVQFGTDAVSAFTEGFKEDGLTGAVEKFMEKVPDAVEKFLPKIMQSATNILQAIVKSLPSMLKAFIKTIPALLDSLGELVPVILESAGQIIKILAEGLSGSLPTLIPTIVHIALEIVDVLTRPDTLSTLIDASIAIIIALADGLIEALPELIERAPEIIDNLVTAIVDNIDKLVYAAYEIIKRFCEYLLKPENVDKILTAAMDIVVKIAKGITDAIYKITQAVREIAEEIADMLGWGDYWRAGQEVIDEFMGGVTDAWNRWQDYWENIGERVYDLLHPNGGEVDISVTPNDEPGAATGAYITRPTRLLTGEGGKKEVILPLEQNTGWADILAAKLQNVGVGGGLIINNLTINAGNDADARDLAHAFIAEVDTELRNYQINQSRGIGGTGWAT